MRERAHALLPTPGAGSFTSAPRKLQHERHRGGCRRSSRNKHQPPKLVAGAKPSAKADTRHSDHRHQVGIALVHDLGDVLTSSKSRANRKLLSRDPRPLRPTTLDVNLESMSSQRIRIVSCAQKQRYWPRLRTTFYGSHELRASVLWESRISVMLPITVRSPSTTQLTWVVGRHGSWTFVSNYADLTT